MAKQKYGDAFVAGLKRNMEVQGISPKSKPSKPIGYLSPQTLKYLPGEIAKTTARFAGAPGKAISNLLKRKLGRKSM